MKTGGLTLFLLIIALTLGSIRTAQAEDFIFTVPVRLSNLMRDVSSGYVICMVYAPAPQAGAPDVRIGVGSQRFQIDQSSGNFSQNLVVKFDAGQGFDPSTATSYACQLELMAGAERQWVPSQGDSRTPPWARPKPGTPFANPIRGIVPR